MTLRKQDRGFTLVELLVTLVVGMVLFMYAIPNFRAMVNAYRLTTAANEMVAALNGARMAAVQRNVEVQFCSNSTASNDDDTLGGACNAGTAGQVIALTSPNATTFTTVLKPPSALANSSIQIHGNVAAVRFNGQGQGLTPGTTTPVGASSSAGAVVVAVCSTALSTGNTIQVSMAAGSVITSSNPPITGTCP